MTLVVVSRAPLAEIAAYKKRMGWKFKWVSSYGSDFNHDFHVSFAPEEKADGEGTTTSMAAFRARKRRA